jgi:hypothetical protein
MSSSSHTGTPNGNPIGAYTLDGTDFFGGQITFGSAARIDAILAHILDGTAGETFSIVLYDDTGAHLAPPTSPSPPAPTPTSR